MKIINYLTFIIALIIISCSNDKPAEENASQEGKGSTTSKTVRPTGDNSSKSDILLKLNMKKGDSYLLTIGREEKLTQSMGAEKQSIKQTENFTYNCSISDVKDNGEFTAEIRFDRIFKEADAGARGKQTFDSDNSGKSKDAPPEVVIFKNMIGMKYSVTLDNVGKVKRVSGSDKLVKGAMKGIKLDAKPMEYLKIGLEQEFSEKQLSEYYEKLFNYLDGASKNVGDKWEKNYDIQSGMSLNVNTEYELAEINNDRILIKTKSILKDKAGKQTKEIENIKVTFVVKGDQSGTIEIDRNTGFIINSTINQRISAKEIRVLMDSTKQRMELETLKEAKYTISTKKK